MARYFGRKVFSFVALGVLSAMAAPARGTQVQWDVRGMQANGSLMNLSDAQALLDGQIPALTDGSGHFNTLNFNEPDYPLGGLFKHDAAFPGTTSGHEQDFAAHASAYVKIPAAGKYTFGVSSDDGFSLSVGNQSMALPGLRPPGQSYATFTFAKAGAYPINVTFFQHHIAAELEVFATRGIYSTYGQAGSNFQLVGDTMNGGLALVNPDVGSSVPEPSSAVLAGLCLTGALLRRGRAG